MGRKPVNLEYVMRRAEEKRREQAEEEYKQFCAEQEAEERERAERQAHLEEVCNRYYQREKEAERKKIEAEAEEKEKRLKRNCYNLEE